MVVGLWTGSGNGSNNQPKITETAVPAQVSGGGPQNDTRSWNLGKYVLSNPTDGTSCTVNAGGNLGATCTRFKLIDDSWSPTFHAQDVNGTYMAYDATAKTYDAHYLIGNYYQFNTATAGTGASVTTDGANAPASICPAGQDGNWVLPTSGSNTGSGSFKYLLDQYNATPTTIVQLPLAFVRSGNINLDLSQARGTGEYGCNWPRTSGPSTYAYYMSFNPSVINPSVSTYYRWYGLLLRCLFLGN